jgi:3'-phosphoadenosine 5'-phosphosulfate sulfotransferase (PAPS reductase)/FAD synthetase
MAHDAEQDFDFGRRLAAAERLFERTLEAGTAVSFAYSSGKDSSAALGLGLAVAARRRAAGLKTPPLYVLHGDTGIENPEVAAHAMNELAKVREFARVHDLNLTVRIAHPHLASSWAYRTIGSGKLPSWPGDQRDCSVEYKVKPQTRELKAILKEAGRRATDVAICIGTRFEESAGRAERMTARGETGTRPWLGANGHSYLSPLADWSEDDVWEYLTLARSGAFPSYTDHEETLRIYRDAGGSSCHVVAAMATDQAKSRRGCGARHGCHQCQTIGVDQSLVNMIEAEPRYHYMRGLSRLQQHMAAIRYDWTLRSWLPRSIDEHGFSVLQPDTFSPAYMARLFGYVLTLDVEEALAAQAAGLDRPRFQVLSPELVVAIDAEWSRQGFHFGHRALEIYRDVVCHGVRHAIPDPVAVPRTPIPKARYLHVGRGFVHPTEGMWTGLRSVHHELAGESCHVLGEQKTLNNGETIWHPPTDRVFNVDAEGALLLLGFELDQFVERGRSDPAYRTNPPQGFMDYLRYGTVQLNERQLAQNSDICRRTHWRNSLGLAGPDADLKSIIAKSMSKAERDAIIKGRRLPARHRLHDPDAKPFARHRQVGMGF